MGEWRGADRWVGRLRRRGRLSVAVVALCLAAVACTTTEEPTPTPDPTASEAPTPDATGPLPGDDPVGDDAVADAPTGAPALAFSATGITGGGFQNVVSFAPDGSTVVLGGDVSGLHVSDDGGVTWLPVGQGLPRWAEKIAAVAHHPDDRGVVVAAGGFAGRSGGVLRSTDGGRSWSVVDETLFFSGQHAPDQDLAPTRHPRATGNLLQWVGDTLFAATFGDGLHRSTDRGATWERIGFDGVALRGLALTPDGALLVATYGDGLHRVEDPAGSAAGARLGGGPDEVEEVAVDDDGTVVVAAGRDGLWRLAGGPWEQVARYESTMSAVVVGGGRWFAGGHEPDRVDDVREPGIVRSTDGGATWEHVATGDGLRLQVRGSDGQRWWVQQAQARMLPDGGDWTPGQFAVDPTDPDHVLVADRGGVWASWDGGTTWQPSVLGLQSTVHDGAVVAPDGRIGVLTTDFRLLVSDDDLRSVVAVEPGQTKGTALAVDPGDGSLLVATAERDENTDGELFRLPAGSFEAVPLGLGTATGGLRVMAVTAGTDAAGRAVVVAALEEGGVRRLVDGSWETADTDAFTGDDQRTLDAGAAWLATGGDGVVVLLDRTLGLFRSLDAGASFEPVAELTTNTDRITPTGFLATDPDVPDRVWVSYDRGLWRVDGLAATPTVTEVGIADAGPVLAVTGAGLLVVTRDTEEGGVPGLLQLCGDERRDVVVGKRFLGGAVDAVDLDLDARGHLVVTTANLGVVRSTAPVATALPCGVTPSP